MSPAGAPEAALATTLLRLAGGRRAVAALQAGGVPTLILKGAALLDAEFSPRERPMIDVDLLVPRRRYDEAGRLLEGAGLRWERLPGRALTQRLFQERWYVDAAGASVDLHVAFERGYQWKIDYDALFARARPAQIGGLETLRPSAEDMALHTILHLCKDDWAGADRAYEDLRRLFAGGLDLGCLVARARTWGCAVATWLALSQAPALQGEPAVAAAAAACAPSRPRQRALLRLIAGAGATLPRHLRHLAFALAVTDRPHRALLTAAEFAGLWVGDAALSQAARGSVPRPQL